MARHNTKEYNINKFIGKQIYNLRLSKGLSRSKLAETMDLSHQQLAKYESGLNRISAAKLYLISRELETPLSYFFESANDDFHVDESLKQHQRLCLQLSRDFMLIKESKIQKGIADLIKNFTSTNEDNN